jgi:hypothetical protein
MALLSTGRQQDSINPIDLLEEVVSANEWRFDRTTDAEMVVEISGTWCDYRMYFVWQEDLRAIYFSCLFDVRVPQHKRSIAADLLALINEKLWLGHFDICSEELVPMFRHTVLLRGGGGGASVEQLEDLVDIALSECERFFPAFQFVLWGGRTPREAIEAAMLETVGEA